MAEIIEMPKLSDTMTTGTLVKWLKKEGDTVSSGDMIAEVETDKATMEVESFEDGLLLKIYVQEGESVAIGSPICAVGEEGETAPEVEVQAPAAEEGEEPEPESSQDIAEDTSATAEDTSATETVATPSETPAPTAPAPAVSDSGDARVKASPLARKIAEELGVPLSAIRGSGPSGRILKADVEQAAKSPSVLSSATQTAFIPGALEEKSEKVTNMRAAIAKALVKSKVEAPHFYLQSEVDAEALATLRQDLNGFLANLPSEQGGVKLTVNDLILRAAAMAAVKVPAINRSWMGSTIQHHGSVHLAFGVAIDDGLVTPVIRDAHRKTLRQIAAEAKVLIGKARDRKLKPEEMAGSTLTVTNLGMFGITDFYGIINPGNAAILSVGATIKQPVVDNHDQIRIGYRMKVGLSGDHRVIDGAVAAQYLAALREILEKPGILLA